MPQQNASASAKSSDLDGSLTAMDHSPLLTVRCLDVWRESTLVVHGVDLDVRPGSVTALVGKNGTGKSSILAAISGVVAQRRGSVRFANQELIMLSSEWIARTGIAYRPQDGGLFPNLSVGEHFFVTPPRRSRDLSSTLAHFPSLSRSLKRQLSTVSAGERKLLSIACAYHTGARLLLLDEPMSSLSISAVSEMTSFISNAKCSGLTFLISYPLLDKRYEIADHIYFLDDKGVSTLSARPRAD
jgi:branched-chain amino acid transport system ATP-binding protein